MMTVFGSGEEQGSLAVARDVFVHGAILHFMRVGESFSVAAGVIGEAEDVFVETRRGALENSVRIIAAAENHFVWLLQIPAQTALRAVNADVEAALPSGGDL